MTNVFDPSKYVADLVSSLNARNSERLLAHYSDTGELKDPTNPKAVRGTQSIETNFKLWSRALSEVQMDVREALQVGDKVALLIDAKARHTGELEIALGEKLPATNKTFQLEIARFLTINEKGKIASDRTVFDAASLRMQLGLEAPASTPPAAPAPARPTVATVPG